MYAKLRVHVFLAAMHAMNTSTPATSGTPVTMQGTQGIGVDRSSPRRRRDTVAANRCRGQASLNLSKKLLQHRKQLHQTQIVQAQWLEHAITIGLRVATQRCERTRKAARPLSSEGVDRKRSTMHCRAVPTKLS